MKRRTLLPVVVFDVNETLLDLSVLDPLFERSFGSAALRPRWFAQMLQLALVGGLTGRYVDFPTAQRAALIMLAQQVGVDVAEDQRERIVATMARLPAHPDVPEALGRLRDAGVRVATLTNSPASVLAAQLDSSGLRPLVDLALSADDVRALKPAPAPYRMAAAQAGADVGEILVASAHAWDVAGALAAGCRAAFVTRPAAVLCPIGPQPEIVAADLSGVVERLLPQFSVG